MTPKSGFKPPPWSFLVKSNCVFELFGYCPRIISVEVLKSTKINRKWDHILTTWAFWPQKVPSPVRGIGLGSFSLTPAHSVRYWHLFFYNTVWEIRNNGSKCKWIWFRRRLPNFKVTERDLLQWLRLRGRSGMPTVLLYLAVSFSYGHCGCALPACWIHMFCRSTMLPFAFKEVLRRCTCLLHLLRPCFPQKVCQ